MKFYVFPGCQKEVDSVVICGAEVGAMEIKIGWREEILWMIRVRCGFCELSAFSSF